VTLTLVEPVAAAGLAALLAGEIPMAIQWVGMAIAITGLAIVIRYSED
jgi:drug/metabolite transporter (DMT)-like permease